MKLVIKTFLISFSILYILLWMVILFYPHEAEQITKQSRYAGDLYQMAKVLQFKHTLQPAVPALPNSTFESAEIITIGDSFFNSSIGYPIIPDSLALKTGLQVHNYNMQGSGETWRKTNPLDYLREIGATYSAKPRVLLLESVDRGLIMRYGNSQFRNDDISVRTATHSATEDIFSPQLEIDSITLTNGGVLVTGWAADEEDGSPIQTLKYSLDHQQIEISHTDGPRPDVADFFDKDYWQDSGYQIFHNTTLRPGLHTITITAADNNGLETKKSKQIFVMPSLDSGEIFLLFKNINAKNAFISDKLKAVDYLLSNNPFSFFVSEIISTTKFLFTGKISSLTPKYSLDSNTLFYRDEVEFIDNPPSEDKINVIVDNISFIKDELKNRYNIELIFFPMPNKYSLFKDENFSGSKYIFYAKLMEKLKKEEIAIVDIADSLIESPIFPYELSDTHLSTAGAKIAADEIFHVLTSSSVATLSARINRDTDTP